jgi:GAF domain-containing protein
VVPVCTGDGDVVAVLDVDSDHHAAFDDTDRTELEALCRMLGERFGQEAKRLMT